MQLRMFLIWRKSLIEQVLAFGYSGNVEMLLSSVPPQKSLHLMNTLIAIQKMVL